MTPNAVLSGVVLIALAAAGQAPALAHGGEDHGGGAVPITQALRPRTEASTDLFELVGVVEAGRLLIYLDRQTSNAPVEKARVEVEGGGLNTVAVEMVAGTYTVALDNPMPAGRHALTFTVQEGDNADLLSAMLEIPPAVAEAVSSGGAPRGWLWIAGGGAASIAGLGAVALRRRSAGKRRSDTRGRA